MPTYFVDRGKMDRVINGVLLKLPAMNRDCTQILVIDSGGAGMRVTEWTPIVSKAESNVGGVHQITPWF